MNAEPKFTPPPWRAVKNCGYINGSDGVGPYGPRAVGVAIVGSYFDKELLPFNKERWDADARLIAAAPELYAALNAILANHETVGAGASIFQCTTAEVKAARDALSKANPVQA